MSYLRAQMDALLALLRLSRGTKRCSVPVPRRWPPVAPPPPPKPFPGCVGCDALRAEAAKLRPALAKLIRECVADYGEDPPRLRAPSRETVDAARAALASDKRTSVSLAKGD